MLKDKFEKANAALKELLDEIRSLKCRSRDEIVSEMLMAQNAAGELMETVNKIISELTELTYVAGEKGMFQ